LKSVCIIYDWHFSATSPEEVDAWVQLIEAEKANLIQANLLNEVIIILWAIFRQAKPQAVIARGHARMNLGARDLTAQPPLL